MVSASGSGSSPAIVSTPTPTPTSTEKLTPREQLREALFEAGFDIFHGPFSPGIYNNLIETEGLVESGLLSKLPEEIEIEISATETSKAKPETKVKAKVKAKVKRRTEAYLIGNTKHLWPIFLRWLRVENERRQAQAQAQVQAQNDTDEIINKINTGTFDRIQIEDPLDTYERIAIEDVATRIIRRKLLQPQSQQHHPGDQDKYKYKHQDRDSGLRGCYYDLYWSSDLDPSRMVSLARIASCTGFSYLDPGTHLSVHPTFGTWHSYRAVLLLESIAAPEATSALEAPPTVLSNPMSPDDTRAAKEAFDRALDTSTTTRTATNTGDQNGIETTNENEIVDEDTERRKLDEELGRGRYEESPSSSPSPEEHRDDRKTRVSRAWIALRDAVAIGREDYRFDNDQLWYHYTKDSSCLSRGIRALYQPNEINQP